MKISDIQRWFDGMDRVMVALSGGVDSALVAYAAHTAPGVSALAVTANYMTLAAEELDSAGAVAAQIGIKHHTIQYDELANESFARNDTDRCYHCRDELGGRLMSLAAETGYGTVVDGANAGDAAEYRPGMRAVQEHGIRSPLLEMGIAKPHIRRMARDAGLSVHDRPANSCLASRIPWGRRVTARRLAMIEMGERYVRRAVPKGPVRVRDAAGTARIEVAPEFIPALRGNLPRIRAGLLPLGFAGVEVDPQGYVSGGANR